jgi:hypothetical protein
MILLVALVVCAVVSVWSIDSKVDLMSCTKNSAGLGFSFADSESMSTGARMLSQTTDCSQGPLDALYFYIYGCVLQTSVVLDMGEEVGTGFQFTSDKSLTLKTNVTSNSLLLANYWQMELSYSTVKDCEEDEELMVAADGCVLARPSRCDSGGSMSTLQVGCGDISCSGCVLDGFFENYHFSSARFMT